MGCCFSSPEPAPAAYHGHWISSDNISRFIVAHTGKIRYFTPGTSIDGMGMKGWAATGPCTIKGNICCISNTFNLDQGPDSTILVNGATFTKVPAAEAQRWEQEYQRKKAQEEQERYERRKAEEYREKYGSPGTVSIMRGNGPAYGTAYGGPERTKIGFNF